MESPSVPAGLHYDPSCYLCPGNPRAGSQHNPDYRETFVFENDFAALRSDTPEGTYEKGDGLLLARAEKGICRVVCFSPDHSLTLSRMSVPDIHKVIDVWVSQYTELGAIPFVNAVQIFENRGEMMGSSNPHPHCQIWANETIPNEMRKEQEGQSAYYSRNKSCLLCDYLKLELAAGDRIVCENDFFVTLVPFWAVWPFETILLPKIHAASIDQLPAKAKLALADMLNQITTRYDNLFRIPFPYTMGFHQQPTDHAAHPEWHLHAHYYPPLLRSATVKKFMVGYEMLASPQRDITAESAAARLRELPAEHYLQSAS
jgi:UDPglucose--hexose-1-phosphate uridylyltransferase